MAVSTKVWAVAEVVTAADKNTYEQDNFTDIEERISNIETGTYSGDGSLDQTITLTDTNLIIDYVRIWVRAVNQGDNIATVESTAEIMDDNVAGGAIYLNENVNDFWINAIIALGTGEFHVDDSGTNSHPNADTSDYNYMVIGHY